LNTGCKSRKGGIFNSKVLSPVAFVGASLFGREKPIFGHRPILGKKSLFLEHVPYVEEKKHVEEEGKATCGRWRKSSMWCTCRQT
jgi:hypothetical protein